MNRQQAESLLNHCREIERQINFIMQEIESIESENERKQYRRRISNLSISLAQEIYDSIYSEFPDLAKTIPPDSEFWN